MDLWADTSRSGGVYDERAGWKHTTYGSWRVLADNSRLIGRGRCILRAVVLVTANLAGFPRCRGRCGSIALDCCCALGAWFHSSTSVRVGLRTDGTRNAGANGSAAEAGSSGVLSICSKPMYLGVFVGWAGLWVVFGRLSMAAIKVASVMVLGV